MGCPLARRLRLRGRPLRRTSNHRRPGEVACELAVAERDAQRDPEAPLSSLRLGLEVESLGLLSFGRRRRSPRSARASRVCRASPRPWS